MERYLNIYGVEDEVLPHILFVGTYMKGDLQVSRVRVLDICLHNS
jgi:hypothetical protein